MKILISLVFLFSIVIANAQQLNKEPLPYYKIPNYPSEYTAGTMAARMVDALGFRYYWATEGLSKTDLDFRPNIEVRSTGETIDHVYNLSTVILNSTLKKGNDPNGNTEMDFEEKRTATLFNLKMAADILRASDDISQYVIRFGDNEFPFWNQVNGPIADAIWHCGQIASFRRSSGYPINPDIDQFLGKVKD